MVKRLKVSTKVNFGNGTVLITPDCKSKNLRLATCKKVPLGSSSKEQAQASAVVLNFSNKESIDILIGHLEFLKEHM